MLRHFTDFDKKPIILLSPDVRIQTESKKRRSLSQTDTRKKSLIDSGIELFGFKKSNKSVKEAGASSHPLSNDYKISTETLQTINDGDVLAQRSNSTDEPSLWKLFDSIKIHTDKRRSVDANGEPLNKSSNICVIAEYNSIDPIFFQMEPKYFWARSVAVAHNTPVT